MLVGNISRRCLVGNSYLLENDTQRIYSYGQHEFKEKEIYKKMRIICRRGTKILDASIRAAEGPCAKNL